MLVERACQTACDRRIGEHAEAFAGLEHRVLVDGVGAEIVKLFGLNDGRLPRAGGDDAARREARRSCYVGFTRAKQELHMMYSGGNPSPFVTEVQDRLNE